MKKKTLFKSLKNKNIKKKKIKVQQKIILKNRVSIKKLLTPYTLKYFTGLNTGKILPIKDGVAKGIGLSNQSWNVHYCYSSKKFFSVDSTKKIKNRYEPIYKKDLTFNRKGKSFSVSVTADWFVNATRVAKFFNKRIGDWLFTNRKLVKYFEEMSGGLPIVHTKEGRNGGIWVSFELLIQIAQSYDKGFAWKISTWFKKQYLEGEVRINKLEANFQKKKSRVVLYKGAYLYGYLCNTMLKTCDSLINPDGTHSRTNSHASSVPRLKYEYIIYLDKEYIIKFRELLREKFNRDHFACSPEEAKCFIIDYCKLMDWKYKSLSNNELDQYNSSL